ncbi:hypothetical protein KY290_035831 [Solanum tuberosum]|uniref:Reverse transcriptase zinc-binding domain-containing protein n=1 Tax=Solanum tuberosum TaxID=4113 RepID=A0ABQ7TR55_SOLTU|nr:hypothetical protein KY284_037498 [Solanum tuberosum]KAH0737126.1 hypothetical protein KY290_035831 [Solanum tuberosum]
MGEGKEICHLLYADDTIIFCEPTVDQIRFIRLILILFESASGLRVNWGKSSLFQVLEVPQVQSLANILGCRIEKLPTTYLGMPLGYKHKALEIWDGILEKAERKLAKWKAQYLSMGGRLILINSVLDSLPTYVKSLFPIPAKVVKKLDKMKRKFLWQGNKEGKGYCLVKWETVLLSKKDGGLGIRNLRLQNESLLLQWLWRYINEDKALWKEVIVSKYGEASPWCTQMVPDTYGVGVWRTIRNLWQLMEDTICLKVGNGAKTKFWRDRWFDQTPLKEAFPDLFLICVNPEVTIQECWSTQGWDISFRRCLNDWEIERVALLLGKIGQVSISSTEVDIPLWKYNGNGIFSVKSAYTRGLQVTNTNTQCKWNYFWKSSIPTKVKCFTWLVIKRACLTQEVLQKKKRQLVSRCFLCMVTEETNKHLFLHCKYTAQLWNLFLNITGYSWAMPEHTSDLLSCWMRRGGSKSQKRWWRLIPSCIWWSVWRERNARCFEDRDMEVIEMKEIRNQDFGEIFLELKERTMELHNIVKKALNPSYLNTVHIQADQWLQDFNALLMLGSSLICALGLLLIVCDEHWGSKRKRQRRHYLKRGECKYDRKALKRLHNEQLLNFDCISLWEWKQHRFTSNPDKVNNKYYLEPASLEEIVWDHRGYNFKMDKATYNICHEERKSVEDFGDVIREGGGAFEKGLFRGANAMRMKIASAIASEDQLLRRRLPQVISGDNLVRPYAEYKSQGQMRGPSYGQNIVEQRKYGIFDVHHKFHEKALSMNLIVKIVTP